MRDREDARADFIARSGWKDATSAPLAGDASARSYMRLRRGDGQTAILMDADPATGQEVRPFRRVGAFLARHGFSTPKVFAADPEQGFLLLEDFGDALFSRLMDADEASVATLYRNAVDVLAELARISPPPDLPRHTPESLTRLIEPVFDAYAAAMGHPVGHADQVRVQAALEGELEKVLVQQRTFSLRDCHAENLMWLPDRHGVAQVGLLDFQDAAAIHPAYDLASLLLDARRDVSADVRRDMIARFVSARGLDRTAFDTAFAVVGVQRNLRILGVFARLAREAGKPRYLEMMPRVWEHVQTCLQNPGLEDLRLALRCVPEPTADGLSALAEPACA